jgi:hypothetical protein
MNNTSVGELPKTIMNGRYFSLLVPPVFVSTTFLGWRTREASHFSLSMVEFFYSSLILTAYDWCLSLSNLT